MIEGHSVDVLGSRSKITTTINIIQGRVWRWFVLSFVRFTESKKLSVVLIALFGILKSTYVFSSTACPIYPIGISSSLLADAQDNDAFWKVSTRVEAGNFSWMTWNGSPSVPTLANSLSPPGDSHTYVNPFDNADSSLDIGKWVQGSPGVAGSQLVKQNLNTLINRDIIVPIWSEISHSGNNLLYQVESFAVISLLDYKLNGKGWLSFTYKGGKARCYNLPPQANNLIATTTENLPLSLSLSYTDPENDPITSKIITLPEHGVITGDFSHLAYLPDSNYHGFDSFTYLVNDGQIDSNIATVSITILPANSPPTSQNISIQTYEDSASAIILVGRDEHTLIRHQSPLQKTH